MSILKVLVTHPTSPADRELLNKARMVHITGLRGVSALEEIFRIVPRPTDFGHWDENNGRLVIVTSGGEIWLGWQLEERAHENPTIRDARGEAIQKLAPRGKGCFVPLSNGESVHSSDLLRRLRDPEWMPR